MKKLILLVILAFSMVLSPLATTYAATPKVINYQGQLESETITSKAPVLVVFELFEDAAGGSALWIEQKSVTVDKNGFFSVYLGDVNPIDLKFDKQYFVQVTVGNNQPFPRTKLSSTPSAFYAADADTALYANTAGLALKVAPKAINLSNLADEVLTAGGDLMGMYPNPQIKPSAIINNIPDGSITSQMLSPNISTSPSGPAGGDLFGVYPDPLIAVGAVKTDRIFDGAVTEEKIADGAVTNNKIVNLDAAKLFNVPVLNFQVAVNTDATIDGDGTISSPLGLADNAVSTSKIVDGAVTTAKLANASVTTVKIADLNVTTGKLADASVTTVKIADLNVTTGKLADASVTTVKIADLNVTTPKIADGAVTSAKILDETILASDIATGAVTTSEILNSTILEEDLSNLAVTNAKLANDAVRVRNIDVNGAAPINGDVLYFDAIDNELRWGQENVVTSAPLTGNGTVLAPVTLDPNFGSADELLIRKAPSGWVSSKINTANINDAAITNAKLADNSVTTNKIVDGTIIAADLADGSVTSAKILDGTIITADLADGSVNTVKIANGSITSAKILDGDVQTIDIANKAVNNAKLEEDAVTGNKVLDGSLSSPDLNATGVVAGIYGDPSALPNTIDVPEYKVDAQGRILASKENSYTVIAAGTIFNESPLSDVTVDGTYDNLDLQIKPGVVGNIELANDAVTSGKIKDGEIMTADIADGAVTSLKIADLGIATVDYGDNTVLNTKIGSGAQLVGKILKADGAGNTVWGDDLGLTLPYTGSYPGPGDAFKLTHTGAAGSGSAAVFASSTSTNTAPAVSITKGVDAGAGSALVVSGTGVTGNNYIAKITNTNGAEGRALLLSNNSPVIPAQITDPTPLLPNSGDEFVKPDPTNLDLNDATLVVRNSNGAVSNQKLAIKTYGSIQANSTIQGTNLVAYGGQVTLYNPTTGAVAAIHPPTAVGDPLNVTPALDLNSTSTVKGLNNIWESFDGNLYPAGTGTNRDVPTALAVSNSIGAIAAEPFITFSPGSAALTNNRIFAVNSTLTSTIGAADNGNVDLSINLANPNTWTGTQTLSAAGNGLVVTTASDLQGTIANSAGSVTVGDDFVVNGTSTLNGQTSITTAASNALQVNNNDVAPTAIFTNTGVGSSIEANGNVTVTAGGLNVTGATDLNTGLNVDGASTLDAVTIAGTLSQSAGQVTLNGNVDATAGLDVTGATTLAGTVSQTGAGNQVSFAGNVDANNGLDVIGAATVAGTVTQTGAGNQVSFAGNVDANNGLDVTGNFTLAVAPIVPVNQIVTVVNALSTDAQLPTAKATNTAIAAVADAQFLTLAYDGDLSGEMLFTPSANFTASAYVANTPYNLDLSNTGVAAASYGNATGTSYSTFTVDAKGRLSAAANQAISVDDDAAFLNVSDVTISGGTSNNLDLQIKTNAVGTNELATADYSGDLAAGLYNLGNLDGTIIGATTPAKGTFTNLVGQTDFTLGGQLVDDIATSLDAPLTLDDTDLVTEGAVFTALAAHTLQVAYNNGNTIVTTAAKPINFTLTNSGFNVATTVGNNLAVTGPGAVTLGSNTSVNGANTFTVGTGATTLGGTTTSTGLLTANGGLTVNGVSTLNGNTSVNGANTFTVGTGATTLGGTTTSTGLLTANGGATVNGVSTLNGNTSVIGANTFTVGTGATTLGGTLAVTGATTTTGLVTTNGGLTMGAAQFFTMGGETVNDIYVSTDAVNPIVGTDDQLITALAVQNALANQTLQVAYNNGNVITTNALDGKVVIGGTETLDLRTSIENTTGDVTVSDNLLVNGANTFTVGSGATTLGGTLAVTGATTATGLVTANGGATVNGATTLAGTVSQTGAANQVTFAGNVDATNGLDVTGANLTVGGANFIVTPTGALTQTGGQVQFGGNVDANNGLDVTGGATVAGGVTVSSGGVAVTSGGVSITAGGLNVSAGANSFGTGVSTFNGNVITNTVDIAGGAGSEIDNTVIGGNVAAAGTFTTLTSTGLTTFANVDINGGNIDGTIIGATTPAAASVTNLVVTGTSDLRGVVSNTTATEVTINDGLTVALQAATEAVNVTSATATGGLVNINNTNAANNSFTNQITTNGNSGASITATGGTANGVGLYVDNSTGTQQTGIAVNNQGTGTNASITLDNSNTTSNSYAVSVSNGHFKPSADAGTAAIATNGTITVGSNTVIRMNTAGVFAGTITLSAGTAVGQILIVTNEDAGALTITAGVLGGYTINTLTAAQFVWNGASWIVMN